MNNQIKEGSTGHQCVFQNHKTLLFLFLILIASLIFISLTYYKLYRQPPVKKIDTTRSNPNVTKVNEIKPITTTSPSQIINLSRITINGEMVYTNTKTLRGGKEIKYYNIDLNEDQLTFTYDQKPEFTFITGNNYSNSGNKIIFAQAPLVIEMQHDTYFNNIFFKKGEILGIEKLNYLPKYYNREYQYNNFVISHNISWNSFLEKSFNTGNQSKIFKISNINTESVFGTKGQLVIKGYNYKQFQASKITLISILAKDIADFNKNLISAPKLNLNEVLISTGLNINNCMFALNCLADNKYDYYNYSAQIQTSFSGNNLLITYDNLPRNSDFILGFIENNNIYYLNFKTIDNLKLTVNKNLAPTKNINNYHICISQPIDESSTRTNLEHTFGSGQISLVFSQTDADYNDTQNKNYCLMFYYYLDPEKTQEFNSSITSIYGEQISANIKIIPYNIPEEYKFATLIGENTNILPTQGFWNDKIQIVSKNYKTGDIFLRKCIVDETNLIKNIKNSKTEYPNILDFILKCDNKWLTHTFKIDNFIWWKEKVYQVPIMQIIKDQYLNIFQATFDTNISAKTFIRTNLGIYTKLANNKLYLWINKLNSGKPVPGVDINIYRLPANINKLDKPYELNIKNFTGFKIIDLPSELKIGYIIAADGSDVSISSFSPDNYGVNYDFPNNKYIYLNQNYRIDSRELGLSDAWGETSKDYKIYAYADRVLYKPGDEVFVAGWVRNLSKQGTGLDKTYIPSGIVDLQLYKDGEIAKQSIDKLDEFGGFKTSFQIPKDASLGEYSLNTKFSTGNRTIEYTFYFKIEEFKKPTFLVNSEFVIDNNNKQYLRITPVYYFGANLTDYNLDINWSFAGDHYGYTDRNWCQNSNRCDEPPYIYNKIRGENEYTGGEQSIVNYTGNYADIPLGYNILNKFIGNLNFDLKIKDNLSQETVLKTISKKIYPQYLLGYKGRSDERINSSTNKTFKLEGQLLQFKEDKGDIKDNYQAVPDTKIKYILYYRDYSYQEEKGADGEWYYANGDNYKKQLEKEISVKDGKFSEEIKLLPEGRYFIRLIYADKYEVEKTINMYNYGYFPVYQGDLTNNMKLDVTIKDKEYLPDEMLNINISPYISGAYAIITVEQGNNILKTNSYFLTGNQIQLPVQADRYPNAFISVTEIVGENINNLMSEKRQEPRILIGYSEVKLTRKIVELNYQIKITDEKGIAQEYYQPGQKIKLQITTTDWQGKGIKSRLSVGIIDKALLDLYDQMRAPIEYFYNRRGNYVYLFSNWKFLYKALKVFVADGSKGGGGDGEGGGIFNVRKYFYDVAFWRGGEFTDANGYVELTATLPDNLTTWVVDIIGITKDLKMGISREYFKVKKNVMLEANLPSFVTMNDKLGIPVRVISNILEKNLKISGYLQLGDKKKDIKIISALNNSKAIIELNIQEFNLEDIFNNEELKIYLEVKNADKIEDAIEKIIPIRKSGLTLSSFLFKLAHNFNEKIILNPKAKFAKINITVALKPIDAFEKALAYLVHYPYGCTEQLMSGLYPIIVAQTLAKQHLISENIIKGDKIKLSGARNDIKTVIEDTCSKIYKNQKSDGGMGYWPEAGESSDPYLSAYVYGAMKLIQQNGYTINNKYITNLENYLKKNTNKSVNIYFNLQNAVNQSKVDLKFIKEQLKNDSISKILGYTINTYLDKNYKNENLEKEIKSLLTTDLTTGAVRRDGVFFNNNILKSYFIRGMIKNNKSDQTNEYVMDLLKLRDQNGVWGRSTQENIQVLLALADFINSQQKNEDNKFSFELNGKIYNGELKSGAIFQKYEINLENIDTLDINMKASNTLLFDLKADYLPVDFSLIKDEYHNVDMFDLQIPDQNANSTGNIIQSSGSNIIKYISDANIGDIIQFNGIYKITANASQLAITYFIPANIGILVPPYDKNPKYINYDDSYSDNNNNSYTLLNFRNYKEKTDFSNQYRENRGSDNSNWYSCWPTFYEIRYDRLFIYYDKLTANSECIVEFKGIKTHTGDTTIMPANLWEMYNTSVWARKNIK